MKIKFLKRYNILILIILAIFAIPKTVYGAGNFSISSSSKNMTPGSTTTITVTANNCAGQFSISSSNPSIVSVNNSSIWLDNSSITITLTAKSEGTASITIKPTDVTDTELNDVGGSKRCTVTVKSKTTSNSNDSPTKKPTTTTTKPTKTKEEKKSTDSTLSSLSIAEGAITPEFSKDVKEYAITVPNEVTKLNITATPTDSKASVSVTEYEELKEGENAITISVTAEDGTTKTDYVIKATRQKKELALEKLIVKYTNQNGEVVELPLTPEFISNIYEYSIETLEYWVKSLDIEALANIEGATIEISGADSLKEGENIITITVKNKVTVEAQEEGTEATEQEETKTYTIKFNRNAEPTIIGRISNWFKGIFGGISTWYGNNQQKVIVGGLALCIIALIGLSIYIVIDYKKYKDLLSKVGKLNTLNNSEVKVATETAKNSIEDIYKDRKNEINNEEKIEEDKNDKPKGGKHF